MFLILFFDLNDQRVLYRKYVQISNKEDFDDLIIKRYKELNNFNNAVASNEEIQKTFEKLYLNNQPIDQILEQNHIYIIDSSGFSVNNIHEFVIPFKNKDSQIINLIPFVLPQREPHGLISRRTWGVFLIPKDKIVKFNQFPYHRLSDRRQSIINFKNNLLKWYQDEYRKFYKES